MSLPDHTSKEDTPNAGIVSAAVSATSELALCRGHAYDLLPKIVVVGQAKAGKRSVVGMLAGTHVPHGWPKNTWSPVEIYCFRTAEENWRVAISLRHHGDKAGRPLPVPTEVVFGDHCFDRKIGDQQMQKARSALHRRPDSTICVKVFCCDCKNLSLVYLPSLAPCAEQSRQNAWIEDVNKKCMRNPASILLLVVDCNDDLSSNPAYILTRRFDPAGERTLVALNKLDVVKPSRQPEILRLLRSTFGSGSSSNDIRSPHVGFYGMAGRTPDQARSGVPLSTAIEAEAAMFRTWPEDVQARCGASNLYRNLIDVWHQRLTQAAEPVLAAVQTQLDEVNKALGVAQQRDPTDDLSELKSASSLEPGRQQDRLVQAARLERAKMCLKKIIN